MSGHSVVVLEKAEFPREHVGESLLPSELAVLERYLPEKLSDDELDALIDTVLTGNGFSSMADMGQAMKAVNAEVAGRAEGRVVADKVKAKLA